MFCYLCKMDTKKLCENKSECSLYLRDCEKATPMTSDEMIKVIEAHKRGELIETRFPTSEWSPCPNPLWNFGDCEYRAKPKEPRRFYIKGGDVAKRAESFHPSVNGEIIPVIELTPEVAEKLGIENE